MAAAPLEARFSPPPDADDVTLAAARDGRLFVCASASSLREESTFLAEVDGGKLGSAIPVGRAGQSSFRPALCASDGGVLAVACAGDGRLVGLWRETVGGTPSRWEVQLPGAAWHAALAADPPGGSAWLAIELRSPGERRIAVGRIEPATGTLAVATEIGGGGIWCRWPALALAAGGGLLLAWCEGAARGTSRVHVARVSAAGKVDDPMAADPGGGAGDAPALAAGPDGRAVVAWHAGGAAVADGLDRSASIARSLRASLWDPATGSVETLPAAPPGPGGSDPRGQDQSWELPSVAVDRNGAIWLAGRSSHGHHLARLAPGGRWSERLSLCQDGWGGRGRRLTLLQAGDAVWLARRGPEGIEVRTCPLPPESPGTPEDGRARPRGPASQPAAGGGSCTRSARVLFGDLHQHTAHSDGCGSAEDLWIAARERRALDFAAVTDHDRFCRRSLGPATWRYLCHVADDFDEPGRFAALRGYEFTGARHPGPGHKCVYFGDRAPERVPDKDLASVFAAARELGGIAVPHHVGWTGGDFAHHDPAVQPVWEICSVHGCYEREGGCGGRPPRTDAIVPGQFVRDALDAGLRFGFIASTDHHGLDWHHGIAPRRNPLTCGLACVVGAEPTRESVLAALRDRRCYGTTGARIVVRVEVDGAPMGSELPADARGELLVEVDPGGSAPVARVTIVHSAGEIALAGGPDPNFAARAPLPRPDRPGFYLYVRIDLADGEQAWASPFWIG